MRQIIAVIPFVFLSVLTFSACQREEQGESSGADDASRQLDMPGNIIEEDQVLFSFPELPWTEKDQAIVNFPDSSLRILDSFRTFMAQNPNVDLLVTGLYAADEKKPGDASNLGMTRAAYIKSLLIDRGLDSNRITLSSRMDDLAFDKEGRVSDGYRFRFLRDTLGELDRTVYFWAAEDLIRWDPNLKDYCDSAQQYLAKNPGKKMVLTGHTDYNGNILLGEWRAESLLEYFIRFGLDSTRVDIRSEGPNKPVAPNDTQENKSKNRRVEITFE